MTEMTPEEIKFLQERNNFLEDQLNKYEVSWGDCQKMLFDCQSKSMQKLLSDFLASI